MHIGCLLDVLQWRNSNNVIGRDYVSLDQVFTGTVFTEQNLLVDIVTS